MGGCSIAAAGHDGGPLLEAWFCTGDTFIFLLVSGHGSSDVWWAASIGTTHHAKYHEPGNRANDMRQTGPTADSTVLYLA